MYFKYTSMRLENFLFIYKLLRRANQHRYKAMKLILILILECWQAMLMRVILMQVLCNLDSKLMLIYVFEIYLCTAYWRIFPLAFFLIHDY